MLLSWEGSGVWKKVTRAIKLLLGAQSSAHEEAAVKYAEERVLLQGRKIRARARLTKLYVSILRGYLCGARIQSQHFGFVPEELLSVLDDSFGDAIEVFDPVGFEVIEHSLEPFNELGPRLSDEHVRRAELCNDLGI